MLKMRSIILSLGVWALGCGDDKGLGPDAAEQQPDSQTCTLDSSTTVKLGGIFPITGQGGGALGYEEAALIQKLINDGCGVMGSETSGIPVDVSYADGEDSMVTTLLRVDEMAANGVVNIVVSGTQSPFGIDRAINTYHIGASTSYSRVMVLNSCTEPQLVDPTVTKYQSPTTTGLCSTTACWDTVCWDNQNQFFRPYRTGEMLFSTLAKYLRSQVPTMDTAASIGRSSITQVEGKYLFADAFRSLGGTIVGAVTSPASPTVSDFKALIPTLVANDPKLIYAALTTGEFPNFLEAWVELGVDPAFTKPSNYDNVLIFSALGLTQVDFSTVSPTGKQFAAGHYVNIDVSWDPTAEGYRRWVQLYRDYYPDRGDPNNLAMATAFDAWMVTMLAIMRANSTDAKTVGANIRDVMNPPGTVYYPDQYKEARAAILRGEDIDYEGAITSDLDDQRNSPGGFMIWHVAADATPVQVGYVTPDNVVPR